MSEVGIRDAGESWVRYAKGKMYIIDESEA